MVNKYYAIYSYLKKQIKGKEKWCFEVNKKCINNKTINIK